MGKTETIRQRAVTIYLPTKEMIGKWKAEADLNDMSLSGFITEIVDDAMRKKSAGMTPREELEKRLVDALTELKVLRGKVESADVALKRADETIADYRKRLERTVPEELDPEITSQLVTAFMKNRTILTEKIPESVGIDFNDREGSIKVYKSLQFLRASGLVENNVFDWRWKLGKHKHKHKPRSSAELRRRHNKHARVH